MITANTPDIEKPPPDTDVESGSSDKFLCFHIPVASYCTEQISSNQQSFSSYLMRTWTFLELHLEQVSGVSCLAVSKVHVSKHPQMHEGSGGDGYRMHLTVLAMLLEVGILETKKYKQNKTPNSSNIRMLHWTFIPKVLFSSKCTIQ